MQPFSARRSAFTRIFCVSLLWLSAFAANGQAALLALIFGDRVATEHFHISVDAGLNLGPIPTYGGGTPRAGIYFGLGTFIKINEQWTLNPEFKPLSFRGLNNVTAITPVVDFVEDPEVSLVLNYLEIPVLLRYQVSPRIYFAAGPQVAFLMSAEQEVTGVLASGVEATVIKSEKSTFSNVHAAFPIEMGFVLHEARDGKGVDFRLRYAIGLSDMVVTDFATSRGGLLQFFLTFPFVKPKPVVQVEP